MFFKFIHPTIPSAPRRCRLATTSSTKYEIKFDGFRVQIYKLGDEVELYSRSGSRSSRRFPGLVEVLRQLPVKSAILDGEIVASDVAGMPDFWRPFLRSANPAELHVWVFDLLALNNKDLRRRSLGARQGRLQPLLSRFGCPAVLCSEPSNEGVVSKRRGAPYRSGTCRGWRKIKTTARREANRERWRLFE